MKFISQGFVIGAGLVTGSVLALSASSAQAATFDNSGISFDTTTTVDFNFVSSNGEFRSDLGVFQVNGDTTTFLGTILLSEAAPGYIATTPDYPGVAAISSSAYTFAAGTTYTLGLISELFTGIGSPYIAQSTVFSTTSLNSDGLNATFDGNLIASGSTTVTFDDNGAGPDNDFNDFVFTASVASVPEPTTLAGLGLVAGALAFSRRRKVNKTV